MNLCFILSLGKTCWCYTQEIKVGKEKETARKMSDEDRNVDTENLSQYNVTQLKAWLRDLGLQTSGNKNELVLRLQTAKFVTTEEVYESAEEDDTTEQDDNINVGALKREMELMKKQIDIDRRERILLEQEREFYRLRCNENQHLNDETNIDDGKSDAEIGASNVNSNDQTHQLLSLLPDFTGSENFLIWEKQLLTVRRNYNVNDCTIKRIISMKLKDKALNWFYSKSEYLEMNVNELLREMKQMFYQRESKLTLRRNFETRIWQNGETFTDYFYDKVILGNYINLEEEELIDSVIDGIPDENIKSQARIQNFSTRHELLSGLSKVSLKKQSFNLQRSDQREAFGMQGAKINHQRSMGYKSDIRCYNCNVKGHYASNCTKAKREMGACHICGDRSHKAADCKQSRSVNLLEEEEEENQFVQNFNIKFKNNANIFFYDCILDTGSPISFIKEKACPNFDRINSNSFKKFQGINKSQLEIIGLTYINVSDFDLDFKLFVVSNSTMEQTIVLGRNFIQKTKYFSNNFKINNMNSEILNINLDDSDEIEIKINAEIDLEYKDKVYELFKNAYLKPERPKEPRVRCELKLNLSDEKPFNYTPRRLSYVEKTELQNILDRLIAKKYIRPSDSEYASPIVLTTKRNNEKRMCIDYRNLNKATLRENYPIPLIDDLLDKLVGKRYYTLLDLKDGFYHVYMEESSIKYTSFVTPLGQFEFLRMPFGLKTAPSKFQRFINKIFGNMVQAGDVMIYLDDIMIASKTLEEHLKLLDKVFKLLVDNRLELRIDKCSFLNTTIDYLGYTISNNTIKPNFRGIESVKNFAMPQNVKQVHSFLGLCSYFRRFIQNFSILAKPLYDLIRKNKDFKFGSEEMETFNDLKDKLSQSPVLGIYDPRDETELHCDASSLGFGSILLQKKQDGKFHPIFYFSKRTTETESKYHSFELETLAIIYSLRRFRIYLQGLKFKIVTDCNSLTMTLNKREINPRISRWALELQNYEYVLEHRPGDKMSHVDALSRVSNILILEENPFEQNLSVCQNLDDNIKQIRKGLEEKESSVYEMRNGLVYRKQKDKILFYVPSNMEQNIIYKYHDELGHLGLEKTRESIEQMYWFPNMNSKIQVYIKNCLKCVTYSPSYGKQEGTLHSIPKGDLPFQTIHIDHYGPVDNSRLSKKHIFLIIDGFTKYVRLYAVKTTNTREVINCLRSYFSAYSRPNCIVSDRGSCYTSKDFEEFMHENNIKHAKIATGSPQANGQVERVNRCITPMLAKLRDNENGVYWDKVLPHVEYALNNTINKSTGTTPSKLLFGIGQRGVVMDCLKEALERRKLNPNIEKIDLAKERVKAKEKIEKTQTYSKEVYNRKRKKPNRYEVGNYVMIRNYVSTPGVIKKLLPKFRGPYEVKRVLRNDRYVIGDIVGHQVTQIPYQGVWEAANMRSWLSQKIGR